MTEQYIHWPNSGQYPATSGAGNQMHPTSDDAVADTATVVHSMKGSTWERLSDETMAAIGEAVATVIDSTNAAAASGDFEVSLDRISPSSDYAEAKTAVLQEIWSRIVTAERGVFLQITTDMLEANLITGDKIAAGAIDGQVITGATIRTAAAGARVQLDSTGLRAWNSAGELTTQIKGQAAEIVGGTITGATVRTSSGTSRTEMSQASGLRVVSESKVVAQLSSSVTNGLALMNPATNKLTPVAGTVFGAQFKEKVYTSGAGAPNSGNRRYEKMDFTASPSGRGVVIVYGNFAAGATSPLHMMLACSKDTGTTNLICTTGYVYKDDGHTGGAWTVMGMATGLPTSGTFSLYPFMAAAGSGYASLSSGWSVSRLAVAFIPT